MESTKGGENNYELCPSGNHPGAIVGLFDVGHHEAKSDKGEPYSRRELILCYEIAKKKADGKPFILGQRYTWSLRDNSTFYKIVAGVRGTAPAEGEKLDPRQLIGTPILVQVAHKVVKSEKGEKTYHNVASVSQYPEGLAPYQVQTPSVAWSVAEGRPFQNLDWLPWVYGQSIEDWAKESEEGRSGKFPTSPGSLPSERRQHPSDDDVPF
jgi:hypothetical protein